MGLGFVILAMLPLILSIPTRAGAAAAAEPGVTLEEVRRRIAAEGFRWTAGPTPIAEQGWAAVRATLGWTPPAGFESRRKVDLSGAGKGAALPARWDWREHDGVTPVQAQGQCGSCWAFSSIGALEACARIDDHEIYDLSEQQMLSCNRYGYGCDGGDMAGCYELFLDPGAVSEEIMPYLAWDSYPCGQEKGEPLARISDWFYLEENVASIKEAVYTYGPVPCAMTVHSDFPYYTGGCYERPQQAWPNHAVVIVGWDDAFCDGDGAWICKNSWGTRWGESGYFHIRYGDSDIGTAAAALVHIPRNIIVFDQVPLPSTTRANAPFTIEAGIASKLGEIDPSSASLFYRVGGGEFARVPFVRTGQAGRWKATIPGQPRPSTIEYYLHAADREGHSASTPVSAPDSLYAFDVAACWDAFENPDPDWAVGEADDDATSGIWERVVPVGTQSQPGADHTARGSYCWVTGQHVAGKDPGANDVDGGRTTLLSPRFELHGATVAHARYWRWFSNNMGASPSEDAWIVQARNGDGPWRDIETTTRSSNAWILVDADLAGVLGLPLGTVQMRFIAADLGRGSAVEAAIDDLSLLADPDTSLVWGGLGRGFRIARAAPNPFRTETMIRLDLDRAATATIDLFSAAGRHLATLLDGEIAAGRREIPWGGLDGSGRRLPSGVYFCRAVVAGERVVFPIQIVR